MELAKEFIGILDKDVENTIEVTNDWIKVLDPQLKYLEEKLGRHRQEQIVLMKVQLKAKTPETKYRAIQLLEVVGLAIDHTDVCVRFTGKMVALIKKRLAALLDIKKTLEKKKAADKPQIH